MKVKRLAIFLMVGNVEGGGGVERMYLNFILFDKSNSVDIITSSESKKNILSLNPDFPINRIKTFPILNSRFDFLLSKIYTFFIIKFNNYKLIHIANFDAYYASLYNYLSGKITLSLNLIDCRFFPEINNPRYNSIKEFIKTKSLSGIFSWYMNTKPAVKDLNDLILFRAATVCFTDYNKFKKLKKEKRVVFAARLSNEKRADHYLRAISIGVKNNPMLFADWEFILWGDGENQLQVKKMISDMELENIVKTGFSKDMSAIFNHSSIFVSTQMYENFTSLSMLEAMASGNAIISYDVGQTDFFVKNMKNGILVKEEEPAALAKALEELMSSGDKLTKYQIESERFANEIHNIDNFSKELFAFWNDVLNIKNN